MAAALQVLAEDGTLVGDHPSLGSEDLRTLFEHMLRVRLIDQRMLQLQRAGRVDFVGTATGLEGAIIGSASALEPRDWLWSGLREGGAAVMRGLPLAEYVAQMYGNANDTAKGRQMCNHFQHKASNYPSWSSVIGTQLPHATGAALASKLRGDGVVHAVYFGDGATSSSGFHSAMNLAGVWQIPVVFVCIDNGWAISVSSREQTAAASYADKAAAYGMPGREVDGNDVLASRQAMGEALDRARSGGGPSLLVLCSYRMHGHSSSDDPSKYRSAEEVARWAARDPIDRFEAWLLAQDILRAGDRERLEERFLTLLDEIIHEQEAAPPMALKTLVDDVYSEVPVHLKRQYNRFIQVAERLGLAQPGDGAFPL